MYLGKYYHTLEQNRRVSLPKVFRSQAKNWVITRGLDGGLLLFAATNFAAQLQGLTQHSFTNKPQRDFARLMANEAEGVTPDQLGRIQLPEYLTQLAHLSKQLVVVGSVQYVEIWDRERYHRYLEKIETKTVEISEQVGQTATNPA